MVNEKKLPVFYSWLLSPDSHKSWCNDFFLISQSILAYIYDFLQALFAGDVD